jgi:hypothetical protein
MLKNHFKSELSTDQSEAVNRLDSFLTSDTNCFLLKGYAGTGKTFLMQGLVEYLTSTGRNFKIMAPTGRAAKVISDKTKNDAFTVHKSIYNFNELLDDDHTFKFRYKLNLNEDSINTVYIIDESSMLSDVFSEDEFFVFGSGFLLNDLFTYVDFQYRIDAKIIFVGDNAQLPPIGMAISPALDQSYIRNKYQVTVDEFEMKMVQRQQIGSGILTLATSLRSALDKSIFNRFEITASDDITQLTGEHFLSQYLECVDNSVSDKAIVIAHSNKQVLEYNQGIRQHFFPNLQIIQKGDLLINTKNVYNYIVDIYNSQFLKVLEVSEMTEMKNVRFKKKGGSKGDVTLVFRDVIVQLKDMDGKGIQISCKIIDNLLNSESPRLTQDEQQGLYVDFKNRHTTLKAGTKEFKDALRADKYFNAMQCKYGYAITCHKAQGGEWDYAFVDLQATTKTLSKGFFRWAYTGITRAKAHLYMLNEKRFSPLSEYIVQPVSTITNLPANQYHIPKDFYEREVPLTFSQPFLKAKYVEILEKLNDEEIDVNVSHLQYVERYEFKRGQDATTIDLTYNAKGFTGNLRIVNSTNIEYAQFIRSAISAPLIVPFEFNPSNDFQKELYSLLKEQAASHGIDITNIVEQNNCDRYFLRTDSNCSYLECFYTGQGIYSTIIPFSTKGEHDEKLNLLLKELI